jgi:hypothetical protein
MVSALASYTTSDIISGGGTINLRTESLDYQIKTEAKHFTIGSLPAPISITGSCKHPGAVPEITKLEVRGGAATGWGCCSRRRPYCRPSNSASATTTGARRWCAAAMVSTRAYQARNAEDGALARLHYLCRG